MQHTLRHALLTPIAAVLALAPGQLKAQMPPETYYFDVREHKTAQLTVLADAHFDAKKVNFVPLAIIQSLPPATWVREPHPHELINGPIPPRTTYTTNMDATEPSPPVLSGQTATFSFVRQSDFVSVENVIPNIVFIPEPI